MRNVSAGGERDSGENVLRLASPRSVDAIQPNMRPAATPGKRTIRGIPASQTIRSRSVPRTLAVADPVAPFHVPEAPSAQGLTNPRHDSHAHSRRRTNRDAG